MSRIYIAFLLVVVLALACKPENKSSQTSIPSKSQKVTNKADLAAEEAQWKGTVKHEMTNGSATLRLPNTWERSTRANASLKQNLKVDTAVLRMVHLAMDQMNYDPEVLDVFEMPSADYRSLYILNTDTISLTRSVVTSLTQSTQASYNQLDKDLPNMDVKLVENYYRDDKGHKIVKFKYSFDNQKDARKSYMNTYFVTTPYRSFIVYEISDTPDDISLYLWSIAAN